MTDVLETQAAPANDKLAGRVAFITGGTRSIGAAIAHSLANQGATVAVPYNRDQASAERLVAHEPAHTSPG
jgi:acetoacetyl-CoA reductase/3-oxoacyl-[acyl-carrier protein] reductase